MFKVFLVGLAMLASVSYAGEWKHLNIKKSSGLEVSIDYQTVVKEPIRGCYRCFTYTYAAPLLVNVEGPDLGPKNEVKVVLKDEWSLETNEDQYQDSNPPISLDLKWENGRFTGKLVRTGDDKRYLYLPIAASGDTGSMTYKQKMAVLIGGQKTESPVTGVHQFQFALKK